MAETNGKVVTLDNLSTFKAKMDAAVDAKIAQSGGASLIYATDADIEALFPTADTGDETGT